MRAPQRKMLVVFEQRLSQLIFLVQLFRMRQDFDDGAHPTPLITATLFFITRIIVGGSIETPATEQGKEDFTQRRRMQSRCKSLSCELVILERVHHRIMLQPGSEFDLAK